MAKTYTELEAWAIFAGALVIGVVLTSVFWAYITIPENVKSIGEELENKSNEMVTIPNDFIAFCEDVNGKANWDNSGLRECIIEDSSEKNLIAMKLLCGKFNLSLNYGSFGVKCEGKS